MSSLEGKLSVRFSQWNLASDAPAFTVQHAWKWDLHENTYRDEESFRNTRSGLSTELECWSGETICHSWIDSVPLHVNGQD